MPELNFDPKFMIGSYHGQDYIVVAKHGELSIGIKPLVLQAPPLQMFVGFRVRCHHNVAEPSILKVDKYMENHPCLFTWEKCNDKRASSVLGALFPVPFEQTGKEIMDKHLEAEFTKNILSQLEGMFEMTTPLDDILTFVNPVFEQGFEDIAYSLENVKKPKGYDEALSTQLASCNPKVH
jgi:hypothetical protein